METPQKLIPLSSCLLCASSARRLHSFTKQKAKNENYQNTVEDFLGVKIPNALLMAGLKLCESCFKKSSAAVAFRKDALLVYQQQVTSMKRTKRLPKTPPSALKKNVAENLLDSVEKLKRLKIVECKESKARRCLTAVISEPEEPEDRTLPSLSIPDRLFDHGYTRSQSIVKNPSPCTSNSCDINGKVHSDHDYSFISEESETKNSDELRRSLSAVNSVTMSEDLKKLDTQLKKLCHPGVSVLWKRNPEVLMYENCFAQAVMELKCSCPLLLDVLAVCLGHYVCDENKVTMIGTIYGMILHARNKQISAVQRIYTALAIQCHADNKCSFQYLHLMLLKPHHVGSC